MFVCLWICLFVCVCLFVCLLVCVCVCVCVVCVLFLCWLDGVFVGWLVDLVDWLFVCL